MPQVFKIGSYIVYFWSNEGMPLEPVHVHIAFKKPKPDATKVWITSEGHCLLANNNSKIPKTNLNNFIRIIESQIDIIEQAWIKHFGEISYYC